MSEERRPRPNAEVVRQELDDEIVLVHLRTNKIYALNRTGARLWQLLEAGCDAPRIERELTREFHVDPAELRAEIASLLEALRREGLITDGNGD